MKTLISRFAPLVLIFSHSTRTWASFQVKKFIRIGSIWFQNNIVTLRGSLTSHCWSDRMFLKGVNIRFVPDECWFMADLKFFVFSFEIISHSIYTLNKFHRIMLPHALQIIVFDHQGSSIFGLIEILHLCIFHRG